MGQVLNEQFSWSICLVILSERRNFAFYSNFTFRSNDSFVQRAMTNRNENVRCRKCTFNLLNCHRCADIKSFVLVPLQVKKKNVLKSMLLFLNFYFPFTYICVSAESNIQKKTKAQDSSSRRSVI